MAASPVVSVNDAPVSPVAHANIAASLAQSDRLAPADLALGERSRSTWIAVTGTRRGDLTQLGVRTPFYWIIARLRSNKETRSDPLEMLDRLMVLLAANGWSEAKLRLLEQHVGDTITLCYAGNAQRAPEEIDRAEQREEGIENDLQTARLTALASGSLPTADQLEAEATHLRLEAALGVEKARGLEREARGLRAGRAPRRGVRRAD